jgi:hypothetical protein
MLPSIVDLWRRISPLTKVSVIAAVFFAAACYISYAYTEWTKARIEAHMAMISDSTKLNNLRVLQLQEQVITLANAENAVLRELLDRARRINQVKKTLASPPPMPEFHSTTEEREYLLKEFEKK